MNSLEIMIIAQPGLILYLYEVQNPPDMISAMTSRIKLEEFAFPNNGVYKAIINPKKVWAIFEGETMPPNWYENKKILNLFAYNAQFYTGFL